MDNDRVASIQAALEHMRRRSGMYIAQNAPGFLTYFDGFQMACQLLLASDTLNIQTLFREIAESRGWNTHTSQHIIRQMIEHGLDEQAAIDEITAIYTDLFERIKQPEPVS